MKLLNIDANAKTVKGQKRGYMTAVLYLAPWKSAGVNLCPMAEIAACNVSCLNTAGRGGIMKRGETSNVIQQARIERTKQFFENRDAFMHQLIVEISKAIKSAERLGLTPVFRLNGTSDIAWEGIVCATDGYPSIFDAFPDVQFYDYTKAPASARQGTANIANYALTFSLSESLVSRARAIEWICFGRNVAVVFGGTIPAEFMGRPVINGDESDLRFLDPKASIVGLKAKGKARKSDSGFVVRQ